MRTELHSFSSRNSFCSISPMAEGQLSPCQFDRHDNHVLPFNPGPKSLGAYVSRRNGASLHPIGLDAAKILPVPTPNIAEEGSQRSSCGPAMRSNSTDSSDWLCVPDLAKIDLRCPRAVSPDTPRRWATSESS